MPRFASLVVVLVVTAFVAGQSSSDKTMPKGSLPSQWSKLGLSDTQRKEVYKLQTTYRARIGDLQDQILALKIEEKTKLEAVLTDAQKKRLKELFIEKAPKDKE